MSPASSLASHDLTIDIASIANSDMSAQALSLVRDGVITGEGPTTRGRVHFSRSLDSDDVKWCERILLAPEVAGHSISRAEAEMLFQISDAAADRTDDGRFDDLLAKAVVHHAAAASGLPVPSREVALAANSAIEDWAPTRAVGVNIEVLEWMSGQMRGKRRASPVMMTLAATLIGVTTLPVAQSLPTLLDLGM